MKPLLGEGLEAVLTLDPWCSGVTLSLISQTFLVPSLEGAARVAAV